MIRIIIDQKIHLHTILLLMIMPTLVYICLQISIIKRELNVPRVSYTIKLDFANISASRLELDRLQRFDDMQINCVALAIYGEARGETAESMAAVAYVVVNRAISNRRMFRDTACGVVKQAYQFESIRGTLKSMVLATELGDFQFPFMQNQWISRKIRRIARDVYYYQIPDPTNYATHFWSPTLQSALGRSEPTWSTIYPVVARVGSHIYHE